jgi:hypothetical protein
MKASRRVTSGRPTNVLVRPTQLVADTGMDLRTDDVASACLALGSAVRFAPPRTPATKSLVERVSRELVVHIHLT